MKASYLIWAYLAVGLLYAIFGGVDGKPFSYNLGRGLIWPAVMFPSFGKFLGGLVIVGLCGLVAVTSRK